MNKAVDAVSDIINVQLNYQVVKRPVTPRFPEYLPVVLYLKNFNAKIYF